MEGIMATTGSTNAVDAPERKSLSRRLFNVPQYKLVRWIFAYVALLPVFAVYVVIRIIPILQSFYLSFTDLKLPNTPSHFIGLQNFQELATDENFLSAVSNTGLYAAATVIGSVILGLVLAVVLASALRGSHFFELIYFIPVITPWVPVSIAWKWIYDPSVGLLNYVLSLFGVAPHAWLLRPETALWAIIILGIWKVIGYNMVIFLVGIRAISLEYYEAASLDGANFWKSFRHITWPLLRPITLFVMVVSVINAFNVFTPVYVMTTGGQGTSGITLRVWVLDMYLNAFNFQRIGYASSEAFILFAVILVLTLLQFRVMRED
jgi:multiple sugar transport system permease protein